MKTFSQLVDDITSEVRRPDLTSEIPRYLNQTIRECHFDPETNASLFFRDNLHELQIPTPGGEAPFTWSMPRPATFQKMAAVNYPGVVDCNGPAWVKETTPGRHLRDLDRYYYRIQQTFVFAGLPAGPSMVNVAFFEFPPSLPYFKPDCRPMSFDDYGGKIYGANWQCEPDRECADVLSTNWLLERWESVVEEGVRAKVYKRVSDTERARTSYSLYAQLRRGLITSELAQLYE